MPDWDVSAVIDMNGYLKGFYSSSFNGDISRWDTSSVTAMNHMFYRASKFNQPIGSWDVSKVKKMNDMFLYSYEFNQPIGSWDVSQVTSMVNMFYDAKAFKQPIHKWTGPAATTAQNGMFSGASAFQSTFACRDVIKGPVSSCEQFISILSWNSFDSNLEDDVSGVIIQTTSGSVQFDDNAIVSNGAWVGYVDFSSLRANRNDYIAVHYEVYVPSNSNGFQYSLAVGAIGTNGNGDNFSWFNNGNNVCAHVPWGGISNCVSGKTYDDYKGRWVKLAMVRPAGENLVLYSIDDENLITYTPSNDITTDGVLSQLHFFNQPWTDGGNHLAASGIKMRNLDVRVLVKPIPNDKWHEYVSECLAISLVYGLCTTWDKYSTYGAMPDWDVSEVTDMSGMTSSNAWQGFGGKTTFNGDISRWDTSSVTTMFRMFSVARKFNQPIGSWDVSKVTNMKLAFCAADEFNQPLNDWDVSSVTTFQGMFAVTKKFNQPLDKWDTSNVESMEGIFSDSDAFNQPIGNWNTSKVTNMVTAFGTGAIFNQDISKWDTSSVTNMYKMFYNNVYFNQDIRGWDTSKANTAAIIFGATAFNATFQCASTNGPLSSCVCVLCSCASSSGKMDSNRYCNAAIDGGGWTLAYTVNPNDGHKMGFGAVFWTQSDSSESVSDNVLLRDYVSSAGNSMAAKEIMITIDYSPSDGSYTAYTIWPFRDTTKSLLDYLRSPSANCYTGQGATYEYSKREVVTSVPYDPITNQGGELYINFHYGNNALRFMPSLQCKYSNNGLSCINDDMMTGIGGDFTGMSQSNVYPSFLSGSWDHDALIHGCGSGRENTQGTDYGTSQTSDGTYYRYSVWVR